ncbi:hypothetical protein SARC_11334, partial [Sphaeroforma arctica JP610]
EHMRNTVYPYLLEYKNRVSLKAHDQWNKNDLLRLLTTIKMTFVIHVTAQHIPGIDNTTADHISRGRFPEVRCVIPALHAAATSFSGLNRQSRTGPEIMPEYRPIKLHSQLS